VIGFGGNAMGGTTITEDGELIGFTMKAGRYFTARVVKGRNMTSINWSFDTDREAVGAIMKRRRRPVPAV
jgi:hypothetical protein